ncbi:Laminin subunit [Dirofilaria immitis]
MQKSDASTKASKSSPHESETQTRISSEHTTGTVLSEVTLNIEDLQNFGRRISVRKPDVQDRAGVIGKKEQEVRIHENICQTSQVEMRQSHTDRSKLREATPMFEKTDEKEHLKDERRDSTSKATARSSSKQEKVLHKDESKEDVFRMDCLRDEECQNCKDMQCEIKNLTAKMIDLQKKLKERFRTEKYIAENLSRKEKDKESKKYPTEAKDESQWKTAYEELEKKIDELRREMSIQRDYYQKKIDENKNEMEELEMELTKIDDEINTLEKTMEKLDKENSRYLSIIQEARKSSAKKFEEEKNSIIQSIEITQFAKEELNRSNEAMISRLQAMIKQMCDDNAKLYIHLDKIDKVRKSYQFETMESEEFHRELKQTLSELSERIKNEAKSSDLKWISEQNIRHSIHNFEAIIETILEDNPTFHSLVQRLATFIKTDARGQIEEQIQSSEGKIQKELDEKRRAKDLMNFGKLFSKDVYLLLERLRKIQNEDLFENTQKILDHLRNVEQRIDDTFIKSIDHMSDIVADINDKQCKVRPGRMKSDMEILRGENRRLKEACSHLSDVSMRIERRMKNLEMQCRELRHQSLTSQMDRSRRGRISEDKENEQQQERFTIHQRKREETSEESLP